MLMKKLIKKVVFQDHKNNEIKWKNIKHIDFQDEDIINCSYVNPYYSENNSYDGYFMIEISRQELESDEKYEKRLKLEKQKAEDSKEMRYKSYLRLKKEFDI